MENSFYTKLIYEHKAPDDFGPKRIEICDCVWDMGLNDLLEEFHSICIGATYSQQTFENALADYLEERGYCVMSEDDRREGEEIVE